MIYFITKQQEEQWNGVKFCDSMEPIVLWLEGLEYNYFCLDTETRDLNYHNKDNLLLTQIGNREHQFVIDKRYFSLEPIKEYLLDRKIRKVFHNSDFDVNIILTNEGILLENTYCTYKASKIVYQGFDFRHSMAECAYRELGEEIDKTQQLSFIKFRGDFKRIQIEYAAKDVQVTDDLYLVFQQKVEEKDLKKVVTLLNRAPLWLISRNGMPISEEKWLKLAEDNVQKKLDLEIELDNVLIKEYPIVVKDLHEPQTLFSSYKSRLLKINYNSPTQLKPILKHTDLVATSKDGKDTTGRKDMEKLKYKTLNVKQQKLLKTYLSYAEMKSLVSTFGKNFLYDKDGGSPTINPLTGRIHMSFDPVKNTGRLGQRDPNLQQIPAKKEFRLPFVARDGRLICSADYSSQEGQVMAYQSQDRTYIDFFCKPNEYNGDVHSFVASTMFSKQRGVYVPVSKEVNADLRQKGKIINFMVSFGGSAYALSQDLGLPVDECQILIDAFFAGFPGLEIMFDTFKEEALLKGYVTINHVTNRKRFFPEWEKYKEFQQRIEYKKAKDPYFWDNVRDRSTLTSQENRAAYKLKGDIERAAMNAPIQGTAADMTLTALIMIQEEFDILNRELGLEGEEAAMIINCIHDEVLTESGADIMDRVQKITENGMKKAGELYCPGMPLMKGAEVKPYWTK